MLVSYSNPKNKRTLLHDGTPREEERKRGLVCIDGYLERHPLMTAPQLSTFYNLCLNQQCCYGQKPSLLSEVGDA